jgi:hypothetical protein
VLIVWWTMAGTSYFAQSQDQSTRDWPPDVTPYNRAAVPEDYGPGGRPALPSDVFVVDAVVNNTDPDLTNVDIFGDTEVSIAINPENPDEIVLMAFSGGWGGNAPAWHSIDGGNTWTKSFNVPVPPGVPGASGCPCDQTPHYGRGSNLFVTFLTAFRNLTDVYSGTTTNPEDFTFWSWLVSGGVAQPTNSVPGNADQPWLLVGSDPFTPEQDNTYVAYDDFGGGPDMRVAVAQGSNPPDFSLIDNQSGTSTGFVNPGHRLAVDPSTGYVYSLFQQRIGPGSGGSQNINYILNRSIDGGLTWGLNGADSGIVVANGDSTQPRPKFGTVNALLGGVLHAAVDPVLGDVYYVYGNRDPETGYDRLAIRRLQDDGAGGVSIGPEVFVTDQVEAAIPSVAVTTNGTVGVFYYTFDGFSGGFPAFTAHLAISFDGALTFADTPLESFLSAATDNGSARQRVLGDYMQLKAVDNTFFGAFNGNGVPFGRLFSNHDPIFYKLSVDSPESAVKGTRAARHRTH